MATKRLNQLVKAKRREILGLAARHGAKRVRIFGSVARGKVGRTSDADFLVEFEPSRSLLDHIGLMQDLEELRESPRPKRKGKRDHS